MNLTSASAYAVRAVLVLCKRGVGSIVPVATACTEASVPATYVIKLLGALNHAGIVTSHRGHRGGFALSRDAADVTLLDVLRPQAPTAHDVGCLYGPKLCSRPADALCCKQVAARARAASDRIYGTVTLAQAAETYKALCQSNGRTGVEAPTKPPRRSTRAATRRRVQSA